MTPLEAQEIVAASVRIAELIVAEQEINQEKDRLKGVLIHLVKRELTTDDLRALNETQMTIKVMEKALKVVNETAEGKWRDH